MKWIFLALSCVSSVASAEWNVELGQEVRYFTESQSLSAQYPYSVRVGYLLQNWNFSVEYTTSRDKATGNNTVWVRSGQTSSMLWVRRSFLESWGPFIGLGAGLSQEFVQSGFYGSKREDYGDQNPVVGIETGWWAPIYERLTAEVFFKGILSSEISPQWASGVRFGVYF